MIDYHTWFGLIAQISSMEFKDKEGLPSMEESSISVMDGVDLMEMNANPWWKLKKWSTAITSS